MLILSLLRFTSVSSQTSPSLKAMFGVWPKVSAGRPGKIGGAFSWSLRCSPCKTSSVFSRSKSPGTGVTLTTLKGRKHAKASGEMDPTVQLQNTVIRQFHKNPTKTGLYQI